VDVTRICIAGKASMSASADSSAATGGRLTDESRGGAGGPTASKQQPDAARSAVCRAMSEQHGLDGRGSESTPQEFVRLVGCRDPGVRGGRTGGGLPPQGPKRGTDRSY